MKKSYLQTRFTEISTVVDERTGEVISENIKKHSYIANSKEAFMLLYVNMLPIFIKLSPSAKDVYVYLLMTYNAGTMFEIGIGSRVTIAEYIDISTSAVANAITELKRMQFIYSPRKSMYQLNPRYAFKGGTKERNKSLKALIELGCKDC